MALFVDGCLSTVGDLQRYESSILEVARTEGIDLELKLGLAQEELQIELQALLLRCGGTDSAAVASGIIPAANIVATLPLLHWHRLHTLALIFRDGYHSQFNDRYGAKWKEYTGLARAAVDRLSQIGIGYVTDPVRRPGPPSVSSQARSDAEVLYFVCATAINATGQESAPSVMAAGAAEEASPLIVSAPPLPTNATGWNLYAGPSKDSLCRRNPVVLAPTEIWTLSPGDTADGPPPGDGQLPSAFISYAQLFRRG
jgi:hypothetical protein